MLIVKMAEHEGNHRCLIEKNVPIRLFCPVDGRMVLRALAVYTCSLKMIAVSVAQNVATTALT